LLSQTSVPEKPTGMSFSGIALRLDGIRGSLHCVLL